MVKLFWLTTCHRPFITERSSQRETIVSFFIHSVVHTRRNVTGHRNFGSSYLKWNLDRKGALYSRSRKIKIRISSMRRDINECLVLWECSDPRRYKFKISCRSSYDKQYVRNGRFCHITMQNIFRKVWR